jgi:hypothetical protein
MADIIREEQINAQIDTHHAIMEFLKMFRMVPSLDMAKRVQQDPAFAVEFKKFCAALETGAKAKKGAASSEKAQALVPGAFNGTVVASFDEFYVQLETTSDRTIKLLRRNQSAGVNTPVLIDESVRIGTNLNLQQVEELFSRESSAIQTTNTLTIYNLAHLGRLHNEACNWWKSQVKTACTYDQWIAQQDFGGKTYKATQVRCLRRFAYAVFELGYKRLLYVDVAITQLLDNLTTLLEHINRVKQRRSFWSSIGIQQSKELSLQLCATSQTSSKRVFEVTTVQGSFKVSEKRIKLYEAAMAPAPVQAVVAAVNDDAEEQVLGPVHDCSGSENDDADISDYNDAVHPNNDLQSPDLSRGFDDMQV